MFYAAEIVYSPFFMFFSVNDQNIGYYQSVIDDNQRIFDIKTPSFHHNLCGVMIGLLIHNIESPVVNP